MSKKTRKCGFCYRVFTYEDLPEGSVVYLGICACADCLETKATDKFRELVETHQDEIMWEAIGK